MTRSGAMSATYRTRFSFGRSAVQCPMGYGVIQWATGGVGTAAIEGILGHTDLELVGAKVFSDAKHGKDVGEIIGREPIGVLATMDADEILAMDADCVIYAP